VYKRQGLIAATAEEIQGGQQDMTGLMGGTPHH
jgi:hypothetical protein